MAEEVAASGPLNFHRGLDALLDAAPNWLGEITGAVARAFDGDGANWLLTLAIMLAAGFAAERLGCWKLAALNRTICTQASNDWRVTFGYAVFRVLFDLAGVLIFAVGAWIALYFAVDAETKLYRTLGDLLVSIVTFRGCLVVARAALAPRTEGIRPIALDTPDARAFYYWAAAFIGLYSTVVFVGKTLFAGDMMPVLARATVVANGVFLVGFLMLFIWVNRSRFTRLFAAPDAEQQDSGARTSSLRQLFAQSWPFMALAWLAMLWVNWAYAVFTEDRTREASTEISWWITLLFPIADRLFNALLTKLSNLSFLQETGFEARRARFVALVQTCFRVILVVVALAALAVTWNIGGTDLHQTAWGERAIGAAVDIGLTVLIAYILYELVMSLLDKHMPAEPDPDAEIEGEGGGAGASRGETLAPLLRGVFVVLLVIVVALTVLSALGVQILPLIAGASIIGLAIGFGSQKLVQDVISGVFFLVDDAFRRGEYIDIGGIMGTVEKISVRSMQLRHHMGALHTIPFGEVRHLTNYSRDWVMMKLKLRLTYDTDVERVRKLIKKLGQELAADEELGPKFLQPLKSQGVYSMEDDSAMIIRVKFMTRPGDQFVVRKTVYAKIRELFEREGIEFAHRVVSVRLDGTEKEELSEGDKRQIAAAALAARAPEAGA